MTKIMFVIFCSIESIVNGMAEKTDESVSNLEIEYEVRFRLLEFVITCDSSHDSNWSRALKMILTFDLGCDGRDARGSESG